MKRIVLGIVLSAGVIGASLFFRRPEPASFEASSPAANVWWVCGSSTGNNNCLNTDTAYIHGVSFANPCWVYLAGPRKDFATLLSVKPGELAITLPAWPAGAYDVWVYNQAWVKCPTQLVIGTKASLHLDYDWNVVQANPPSGGDDWAYLQGLCSNMNPGAINPPPGGNTIVLGAGTYQLSQSLQIVGHYGAGISLQGQGRGKTFIKPFTTFTQTQDGFINGQNSFGSQLVGLTVNTFGTTMPSGRAFRVMRALDCDFVADPSAGTFVSDGGDGSRPFFMTGCNVTGQGVFCNGPGAFYVDKCNFYLDGFTDAGMQVWSNQGGSRITNTTCQDKGGVHTNQRGRIVVFGLSNSNIYLDGLQTFALAGSLADTNCGEQILTDGDGTNLVSRMYVYNCNLQGSGMTVGASCGFQTFIPSTDVYVDRLTVDGCVYGISLWSTQTNCLYQNITVTNCQYGVRSENTQTTIKNLTASKLKAAAVWVDGAITLDGCVLQDAPLGVWSQNNAGSLTLLNSVIYRRAAPFPGSLGVDVSASKVSVMLQGTSAISGFEKGNMSPPQPLPPVS